MHSISPKGRPDFFVVLRAACLIAAVGAFAACDRHSAEEVPENYGHGSSHERTIPDHQIDSSDHSKSFSDTAGTKEEQAEKIEGTPSASPTPAPGNHFY